MAGALDGLLVADFSRVLAGPYATMLLADLGATVVKVERPGSGDDTRAWGPPYAADGQATYFHAVNRNKRSIALDLADPRDLAIAHELARQADVMIENYKPGGLLRFGLDYDSVRASNPAIVYCSISGFGNHEGTELPGYDLLVQAMGGLMSITGTDQPTKAGVALVDVLTGLHATVGILAAHAHRQATGEGQQVSVTLLGSLLSSLVNQASGYVGAGVVPTFMGNAHPSIAPYSVFACADRPLCIAVGNDAQFRALCGALGAEGLAAEPRFATNPDRVRNREELTAELEAILAANGADHWHAVISTAGVPCGPINDIGQAFELAERLGLSPVVEIADPRRQEAVRQVSQPTDYSRTPAAYASAPPRVDEDRAWVLRVLGLDEGA